MEGTDHPGAALNFRVLWRKSEQGPNPAPALRFVAEDENARVKARDDLLDRLQPLARDLRRRTARRLFLNALELFLGLGVHSGRLVGFR